MNVYKKRGLISILTMVLVIGLLSTAQAVNTDSHRRSVREGDGNNNNRANHARSGRGGTKAVNPTSTSVTTAPTDSSANTDGDNHQNDIDGDGQQLSGNGGKENNRSAYINNLKGDGNTNNIDDHALTGRDGTESVNPTSTSVTTVPTDSSVNTDSDQHTYGNEGDVSQLNKGHGDEGNNRHAYINNLTGDGNDINKGDLARIDQDETTPVKIPISPSVTVALTGN